MQKFKFFTLAILAMLSVNVWGEVVSGTTYNTLATNSLPTGWSGSGGGSSYIQLTASSNYIQTDNFCQGGFSSIKVKARTYGGPSDAQAKITVSWYDKTSGNETVLGIVTPTSTTLTDKTISSPSNPTKDTEGYIKIQCKGASSSKGSGVSQVTITYTTGSCGGGGGGGGGGGETSATYVKATSLSDLCVGAKVIIAASEYNVAMSETQNTNNRGQENITKSGNNATWTTAATDVEEFTLGKTGDYYTFQDKSNNYLYASSSSSNQLKSQATNNANGEWTISFSDGVASIQSHGTNTRNVMQYNQSSSLFACYASASQQSLAIYVKDGDCAACSNLINITKGTPSRGSFTLTGAGTDICADDPVTVTLSNITADPHYHATAVTSSNGGTPSAITDGSATVSGITASTTINVTFAEDTKVVVTLLNNNVPVNAGGFDAQGKKEYYTGETLGDLPTLTSAEACDATSVTFMGWTSDAGFQKRAEAPDFVDADTPVNAAMTLRAVWARAQ